MKKYLLSIPLLLLLAGCNSRPQQPSDTIFVSILPLRSLVGAITEDDFAIEVLVPPGASPETFEPTPRQMIDLNRSQAVFCIGWLDFEHALLDPVETRRKIIPLNRHIEPIAGDCGHDHHHAHGVDPHIWTSPRELRTMTRDIYEAIHALYPDSIRYTSNYQRLTAKLQTLDKAVENRLKQSETSWFLIYHPALTYYARAYGLEQVAIERDGKAPSARRMADLIDRARRDDIRNILYQSQFPASTVEVIAGDIGAEAMQIDPLAEDILAEIERITDLIAL